jgi:hypothetical protein
VSFQSPYAYILEMPGAPVAIFTWPNVAKKYIRDIYTIDGELRLPPPGHLTLTRYRVNPKAGHVAVASPLIVEEFLK